MSEIKQFTKQAFSWGVVRRALVFAVIVGFVLNTINHGECVLAGEFEMKCAFQSALTAVVPYVVSTISSVMAMNSK